MKKEVALSVFLCCLFFLPAFAQNKKDRKNPPSKADQNVSPARQVKQSEEDPALWNEFSSEEHGFWITFPAESKNVSTETANKFASFVVYTKKAHYGLAVRDLLVSLNNDQLDVLFESIIEETEDEKTRLVGNKDVYINGILGKELIYEEKDKIVFGRFYILESKLFMLTVSLRKKEYDKNFDQWRLKFFDSFGVKLNTRMDAE